MVAGGDDVQRPPLAQAAARVGRRRHQAASLPLDVMADIAARTDPATLVRCAATCIGLRGRVADPAFRRRLRLRHADCFVPSFLHGHLEVRNLSDYRGVALHLVDITAADTTATAARRYEPVASRDGLLLVRSTDRNPPLDELRVCDMVTGRSQTLPLEPTFPGAAQKNWEPYVLLVGDGDAIDGIRPFQVLKTNLVMSDHHCYLQFQIFSSEKCSWGRYSDIKTPHLDGSSLLRRVRSLVAGGAAHWLCVTDSGGCVLKFQITRPRGLVITQVAVMLLPVSFPCSDDRGIDYLLATATAGGKELMVLVADGNKNNISAWVQTNPMAKWKQRPQVVMENEAMLRFRNVPWSGTFHVRLHWFAGRSGLVLFSSSGYGEFLLDLQSMEIVRWFPGSPDLDRNGCLPCEIDLASWVPTFSSTI
ncbi:unnamed protein product [Urochloa humidicola]